MRPLQDEDEIDVSPVKQSKICLRPECGHKMATRGLCKRCYAVALELVKKGRTTWERLESEGRSAPFKHPWGTGVTGTREPVRLWFLGNQSDNGKVVVPKPKSQRKPTSREVALAAEALKPPMPILNDRIDPPPNSTAMKAVAPTLGTAVVPICFDCNEPLTTQYARTKGGQTLCVPCAQARAKALSNRTTATIE